MHSIKYHNSIEIIWIVKTLTGHLRIIDINLLILPHFRRLERRFNNFSSQRLNLLLFYFYFFLFFII